jgi:hypothetical protein
MAKYCLVAPIQILESLAEEGAMRRNHLVLAHDIVKYPERYKRVFQDMNLQYDTIILDNGAAELNAPVDVKVIQAAAEIVKPTAIVLPDTPLDPDRTVEDCREALHSWPYIKGLMNIPLMYIPQGVSPQAFFWACTNSDDLMLSDRIDWWGVPRNIVAPHGTRRNAIELVRTLNRKRRIHMFGFSDNLYDDIICSQIDGVNSIDSAVPLRVRKPFLSMDHVGPRGSWWEEGYADTTCLFNIALAQEVFGE